MSAPAVAPWCSGTESAHSSRRMLGLPHKSAACQFGAEDHCVGCQLVGCGFYDCPFAAQRVPRDGSVTTLFSSFEWSSKPFMLLSKFLTFPAMLSVTDHWCHLIVVAVLSIWPLDFIGTASYSNRESYDGDPSHRPSTRPNGSQRIPTDPNGSQRIQRIPAVQGWHHPSPDRYALGRGDASAVGEEQGAFVTFGPFGHEFLKNSGECLRHCHIKTCDREESHHQLIKWTLASTGALRVCQLCHGCATVSIGLHRSQPFVFETFRNHVASQGSHGSAILRPDVHWSLGARRSTWLPKGILAPGSWRSRGRWDVNTHFLNTLVLLVWKEFLVWKDDTSNTSSTRAGGEQRIKTYRIL